MAKQISIITFTGRLGNLIGYRRNGKHFLRSMPSYVRQTAATRRAAQRFGMASKKGALIRSAFSGRLDAGCDSGHINRLTSALIPATGNNIRSITGFRFNRHTGTDRFLIHAPRLSHDGILYISPQALPAYKGIDSLEIKVIAARIDFATHQVVGTESAVLIVKTGEDFKGAACNVDVPGKGTLIVVLQVRGIQDHVPSCNTKYFAADIIAAEPPQPLPEVPHKQICSELPPLKLQSEKIPAAASVQLLLPVIQRE
ncbi:hypothetical protein HHL17_19790 [Chitinophaga sp. G-6-1-13]|uniref:Uncharacterized protein n=1 Tax=Chitinophaga fulva TaxID=2728842 RepID=A0A848GRV0_9BACT|nr:hypothetical protein [Chitinophaga fulva]NML39453.1 hypothetical protein [Chitinophaga fulva]